MAEKFSRNGAQYPENGADWIERVPIAPAARR
jgi:hypothetical protein